MCKNFCVNSFLTELQLSDIPFCTINWGELTPTEYPGVTGKALWRTFEIGNIRMVKYTPGYLADHWCKKGHVLLEGELVTELSDGRKFILTPGVSYQVADDINPHRSYTKKGAKLFIVD